MISVQRVVYAFLKLRQGAVEQISLPLTYKYIVYDADLRREYLSQTSLPLSKCSKNVSLAAYADVFGDISAFIKPRNRSMHTLIAANRARWMTE